MICATYPTLVPCFSFLWNEVLLVCPMCAAKPAHVAGLSMSIAKPTLQDPQGFLGEATERPRKNVLSNLTFCTETWAINHECRVDSRRVASATYTSDSLTVWLCLWKCPWHHAPAATQCGQMLIEYR